MSPDHATLVVSPEQIRRMDRAIREAFSPAPTPRNRAERRAAAHRAGRQYHAEPSPR